MINFDYFDALFKKRGAGTCFEQKINQKIKNKAKEINVGDVNRIRNIVVLERLIADIKYRIILAESLWPNL